MGNGRLVPSRFTLTTKHFQCLVPGVVLVATSLFTDPVFGGPYQDSAHGDPSFGVKRSSIATLGYGQGNCSHCHEPHASNDGSEPEPVAGSPSTDTLFYDSFVSQTDNFCLQCHTTVASQQTGGITNKSYSYRAGNWTNDTTSDIEDAFAYTAPGSSHNLQDIKTFIDGKWGYTADSNPCVACHNPHAAQGDPLASTNPKTSGARGWPVSRPSEHTDSPWDVWGNDANEQLDDLTTKYQAPYRYNTTSVYEPDGTTTDDGSNLTDYITFCTDCHNTTNTIWSTNLGRNLKQIDWSTEKHGFGNADVSLCNENPYPIGNYPGLGKVLSCLDCHEPHGSPNALLLRKEINGEELGGTVTSYSDTNMHFVCDTCHLSDAEIDPGCQVDHYYIIHHDNEGCNSDRPYAAAGCGHCHPSGGGGTSSCLGGAPTIACTNCHFHGSSASGNPTF